MKSAVGFGDVTYRRYTEREKEKSEEEILRAKICHCLPGHGF
jgi:hypothetical protein